MNSTDPEKIIQYSRELEGVAVDLGNDDGDASFMENRLLEIKSLIEQEIPGTLGYAQLIARYNTLLYVFICHLEYEQKILQPSHEIDVRLILQNYLQHKARLEKQGSYTLIDRIKHCDIVAAIQVVSVSWWGQEHITIWPIEVFKGTLRCQEKIIVCTSWGNIYQREKTYLVFYKMPKSGRIISYSSYDWMVFLEESSTEYLQGKHGQAFWPIECIKKADFETLVPWMPLQLWLKDLKIGDVKE